MCVAVRQIVVSVIAVGWFWGCVAALSAQQPDGYARSSAGTRQLTLGGGLSIKLLLEAGNLGSSELEVAEITFPVGANAPTGHRHGSTEIFYVVEGVLGHVVNGTEHRLEPGMVGVVKPGDSVIHRVLSDVPVKAVVLWVPGGEANRIAPVDRWTPLPGGVGP
jgi:mannose-6-phosphate isomerase-like protein (cupin superfamily)